MKKITLISVFFGFLVLVLTVYVFGCGQGGTGGNGHIPSWHIETADTLGYPLCFLALDSLGRPHICYHGYQSSTDLSYAHFDGSSWQRLKVTSFYTNIYNIAVDGNNVAYVFYREGNNLDYATVEGSTLITDRIKTLAYPQYISAAIHSSGKGHLVYYRLGLKYFVKEPGSSWIESTIITTEAASYTDIALDGSGNPHVSYKGPSNVRYARFTGSEWVIEEVTGEAGEYTSIAVDGSGNPHISYYEPVSEDLKYAKLVGLTWEVQTLESDGDVGMSSSLTLDSGDKPHICYVKDSLYVKHRWWTGATWEVEVIEYGEDASSAMGGSVKPKVAYIVNGDLMFAEYQ